MPTNSKKTTWPQKLVRVTKQKVDTFLARRPHRSFRLTRRRDYIRPLQLPGYIRFTNDVYRTIWRYKKILLPLLVVYIIFYAILVGIGSQETYGTVADALKQAGGNLFSGGFGAEIGQASILFLSVASTGLTTISTESQQIFAVLLFLMLWLSVVWLLRNLLAGHKVRMRDGLYSSGSPIFATMVVVFVVLLQLLPVGIAMIGYAAASSSGLLDGGVEAMLFWVGASLLGVLSLYWITSSLFAMVMVTLPGMYPWRALRTAGDIVFGRRIKLLLRWLWMLLAVVVLWAVVLIPFILIDLWVKSLWSQIGWLPIVPVVVLLLSSFTVLWVSTYIYLLYRKVVDNETA